jgi:hypothetical protein
VVCSNPIVPKMIMSRYLTVLLSGEVVLGGRIVQSEEPQYGIPRIPDLSLGQAVH